MFTKKWELRGREQVLCVSGLGECSLGDTLECGQAFRYELLRREEGYVEYLIPVGKSLLRVGQQRAGELLFFDIDEDTFEQVAVPFFSMNTDFEAIRGDIISRTDSEWLKRAAEEAKGIVILTQDPWEALFSFIISQNNNIPRIRRIIRAISGEYGENLAVKAGICRCPLSLTNATPSDEVCRSCGICYSFPTAEAVLASPEGILHSHPGFRYKYLLDAARRVCSGECNLEDIKAAESYEVSLTELKKILGVGDKVASCVALFGMGNLDAFPIDVWMKRAIDEYFDGRLDPRELGKYAGVAQQYIFHYIRNLEKTAKNEN